MKVNNSIIPLTWYNMDFLLTAWKHINLLECKKTLLTSIRREHTANAMYALLKMAMKKAIHTCNTTKIYHSVWEKDFLWLYWNHTNVDNKNSNFYATILGCEGSTGLSAPTLSFICFAPSTKWVIYIAGPHPPPPPPLPWLPLLTHLSDSPSQNCWPSHVNYMYTLNILPQCGEGEDLRTSWHHK